MKIFLLADGGSTHTVKWVKSLVNHGVEVFLYSLSPLSEELILLEENSKFKYSHAGILIKSSNSTLKKTAYLRLLPQVKKEIDRFQPDLLHAHYISSYGLLAYLSAFQPYVLSVWGSDLLVFPHKSIVHKQTIKTVLRKSKFVFSSSQLMIRELRQNYSIQQCMQIPFGIDLKQFSPAKQPQNNKIFTFAIVKSLLPTYGIDIAIKAFVSLLKKQPNQSMQLNIYGEGEGREEYEQIAANYLNKNIHFCGRIPHAEVPKTLQKADVFVNVSRNESFGVSVLEAAAAGLPVIVSNRGGLNETLIPDETGIMLEKLDAAHCAAAMEDYLLNEEMRNEHGKAARKFVEKNYDDKKAVELQIKAYQNIIEKEKKKI